MTTVDVNRSLPNRPNVVVILTDDQGRWAMPYRMPELLMPHLEESLELDQIGERPFYLQVNFTAPHDPWIDNHPQELVDVYAETNFPSVPREQPHTWLAPRKDAFADAFGDPHLAGYCASLTAVDASLGRIRSLLEVQKVGDDTDRGLPLPTMPSAAVTTASGARATAPTRRTLRRAR